MRKLIATLPFILLIVALLIGLVFVTGEGWNYFALSGGWYASVSSNLLVAFGYTLLVCGVIVAIWCVGRAAVKASKE